MSLSKKVATNRARVEISEAVATEVKSVLKDYMQASGIGSEASALEFTESVSKSLSNKVLNGSIIEKTEIKDGRVFVMVTYDINEVEQLLRKQHVTPLKEEALGNEFKARQGFESLDKEFDEMNQQQVSLLLNDRSSILSKYYLFILITGVSAENKAEIPQWFLNPPTSTKAYYYGVGISQVTYDENEGIENAKYSASKEIAKALRVRLKSKTADSQHTSVVESAFFVTAEVDSALVAKIRDNSVFLKQVIYDNYIYIVICISKDLTKTKKTLSMNLPLLAYQIPRSENAPSWTKKSPSKKGFIYGISGTEPFRDQEKSWEHSDDIARLEIASQLSSDIRTVTKEYMSGGRVMTRTLSEVVVDQVLENAIVKKGGMISDYRY